MRVGLFVTCLGDLVYPQGVQATVILLRHLGIDVVIPGEQGCCGQMHVNSGYASMAVSMVRTFTNQFQDCDLIVSPSGSCVGSIREQHGIVAELSGDTGLQLEVAATVPKVRELSEFLVADLGIDDVGAVFEHRVAYHPSCHSLRVARVGDAPYRLLRNVKGLELVEHQGANECCGFGGSFSVKNFATSEAMMLDKLDALDTADVDFVTSLDASCLMHLSGGLRKSGSRLRGVHLAEILAGTVEP